ncbi:MAG: hypothetical protein ABL949_12250 [Fimbriimonadaceae bacterium]
MVLTLLCLLAQFPSKAELESSATILKQSIPEVLVGSEGNDRWELWVDVQRPITDKELKSIKGYRGLTAIRLLDGGFSDKGLSNIVDLPDLTLLVVRSDKLTDKAIDAAMRFKKLSKLDLMQATLTAKGLLKLRRMPALRRLFLHGATFSDADAMELVQLTKLDDLTLPSSLSKATVEKIKDALPKCNVRVF